MSKKTFPTTLHHESLAYLSHQVPQQALVVIYVVQIGLRGVVRIFFEAMENFQGYSVKEAEVLLLKRQYANFFANAHELSAVGVHFLDEALLIPVYLREFREKRLKSLSRTTRCMLKISNDS